MFTDAFAAAVGKGPSFIPSSATCFESKTVLFRIGSSLSRESLKDLGRVAFRNSRPIVRYGNFDFGRVFPYGKADVPSDGRELQCISNQATARNF